MMDDRAPSRQLVQTSTASAGVILVLILFVMVNYLAQRHYKRYDLTSSKLYSLSEKSLNVARNLDRAVDMVIFLNPESPLYGAADELLSRYAAANPDHIRKREVDPAKNRLEAQRLVDRFGIERENVIVIATEDDRRVIDEFDLAEYDYSGAQFGQPPKLAAFKGEQLITSALLALIEAKKPRLVFTAGHGEAPLDPGAPRSLSQARDLLGRDNFEIETSSSLGQSGVPADTDLLVVAGPQSKLLQPELDALSRYLDTGGRVLMMIDPVFSEGNDSFADLGLDEWLASYGIEMGDDVVIDPASEMPFFGPETIFTDSYGNHPIVEALDQTRNRVVIPLARSVGATGDLPNDGQMTELVRTSAAGWGETNLDFSEPPEIDEGDIEGPVTLAVALAFDVDSDNPPELPPAEVEEGEDLTLAEPAGTEEENANEARLVVFGDLDFATDAQLASGANSVLLLNAFNWLVKREELIDIEARRPEQTKLSMSQGEISQVYLLVLLILPGLAITAGIWMYLRRRR